MSGLLPLRGVLNTLITSSIWYLRNLNSNYCNNQLSLTLQKVTTFLALLQFS